MRANHTSSIRISGLGLAWHDRLWGAGLFGTRLVMYGLAVALVGASLAVTTLLEPWMKGTLLPPTIAAVVLSALWGGLGPGTLALVLGTLGLKWFFLAPPHVLLGFETTSAVRLGLFVFLTYPLVLLSAAVGSAMKRAEAEHARTEESRLFLDSIVENIPNMIFVKEATDLRFVLFNRAGEELLGLRREPLLGKTDRELFPAAQAAFFQDRDRQAIETGVVVDIPEEHLSTTKGERILHTKKVPIFDREGKPCYLLGISEDITELKAAERERAGLVAHLEKSVREREEVLHVVSHDLRNPLNAIMLTAQTIEESSADPAVGVGAKRIGRAAARMGHLIEDILVLARFDAGNVKLELTRQDAFALGVEAAEMLKPLVEEKSIQLVTSVPDRNTLFIRCDHGRILQVLSNLIGNAITYGPKGQTVRLMVERAEAEIRFSVEDHGPGIPADQVPFLFERYVRGPGATSGGIGLGLAIAKAIVDAHGGRIGVTTALGHGSTFWFTLPD